MPVTKAFLTDHGTPIIDRNIKTLKSLFHENFIVTNQPERYLYLKTPLLGDVYPVRGPMTGIFTALINASNPWVFICACDMPFINADVIRFLSSVRSNHEAVAVVIRGRVEPLFAFYSIKLASGMENAIASGNTGLQDFLNGKKVQYVTSREIKKFDPGLRSFININTPVDARQYLNS